MSHAIVASGLGFAWPDGAGVFDDLSFTVGPGRTGLIGVNGSGKSTLLRLMAGELPPSRGSLRVTGSVGYPPQDLTLDARIPVDVVLGIARARRALLAIERGDATEENFACGPSRSPGGSALTQASPRLTGLRHERRRLARRLCPAAVFPHLTFRPPPATARLHMGTLVLANDFRHPVIVAHEAASLQHLSGGRFELGPCPR